MCCGHSDDARRTFLSELHRKDSTQFFSDPYIIRIFNVELACDVELWAEKKGTKQESVLRYAYEAATLPHCLIEPSAIGTRITLQLSLLVT